jgi:hypothetical protein
MSSSQDEGPISRIVDLFDRRFLFIVIFASIIIPLAHYEVPQLDEFYFWAGENGSIATSIVLGKGFANPYPQVETGPSAWVAPLFPYLLAAVFRVAGTQTAEAAYVAIFLQCMISAGTIWLLYRIAQRTFSTACARIAILLWFINPARVMFTSHFLSEVGLSTLTLLLAVLALMKFRDSPTWNVAAAGLAFGLAVLCLPVLVLAVPFYLYSLYAMGRSRLSAAWIAPTLAFAVCIAVLTPWLARNYVVFGRFIFIKSNVGHVLYMGNSDRVGERDLYPHTAPQERDLMRQVGESAYASQSFSRGVAWIRDHKKEYAMRFIDRAFGFWVTNLETDVKWWLWSVYQILLLAGAAVGAWRHWRRDPVTTLCCAVLISVPIAYYMTAVYDAPRLRLPFEPLVAMFASSAVTAPQAKHQAGDATAAPIR